ncbi:hypothetical protein M0R45_002619 [Rubus argutus]|uniref:Uncharacterized protein n=1 Tax=Rubus argutus TaxID=59490 RepID=A0AAW1VQZ3_RUBAR
MMRRQRVSSSISQKFWAESCYCRRSKVLDLEEMEEEEGLENEVVGEIEKSLVEAKRSRESDDDEKRETVVEGETASFTRAFNYHKHGLNPTWQTTTSVFRVYESTFVDSLAQRQATSYFPGFTFSSSLVLFLKDLSNPDRDMKIDIHVRPKSGNKKLVDLEYGFETA